MTHFTFQIA